MIAFKDSFESEEDKIKKALKNLMKAVEEVDTQSLLDEVNSSTHLDSDLSEIIDTELDRFPLKEELKGSAFYAVGGGFRTLAKIHIAAVNYPLNVLQHYAIDDVKAFEAKLESKANKEDVQLHKWTWKSLKDSTYESVLRLANEGLDNWEIAQDLDIHKSTVSRYVQRGKEEGVIKPCSS